MSGTGRVEGKVVILTGGRGDLGSASALLLAQEGATVAVIDLERAEPQVSHERIVDYSADVTDEASVADVIARIVAAHGTPDVLVNAAGMAGRPSPSHEATVEEFDRIFGLNVKGVWLMTKHVIPLMIAAGRGSIVNFSSIHGLTGGKAIPLYHATKGAVRLLTKADAHTYGEYGIRVNSIHPGSMRTRLSSAAADASPMGREAYYAQLLGPNAIRRQGEPIEIAYGVLYLASDESSFSTGSELVIDGGYTSV